MISFVLKTSRSLWSHFTATLVAAFIGLLVIFFDVFFQLELFSELVAVISHIDVRDYELDEVMWKISSTICLATCSTAG